METRFLRGCLTAATRTIRFGKRVCSRRIGQVNLLPLAWFVLALSCLFSATPARAQYSANNQTNTISGVSSNWVGNGSYVVGSNWVYDALLIQSGGVLSNGDGYIGYEAAANYNAAIVSGDGSIWSNNASLYVGWSGSGNQLIITNEGAVYNTVGYLGFNTGSTGNTAVVSDYGSVWSNRLERLCGLFRLCQSVAHYQQRRGL